ncbi:MAG: peptidoglycan bridge formation glycyltransferase FemA/FemB family protein [Clostridia bacterium]|nr:peptidoglycan bridge formation glycyltransferase FemA/FemB family protein [Clostridia bacterium]
MKIQEVSKEEYDDFLNKIQNHSFLQSSAMSEVLTGRGVHTKLLGLVHEGEILAVGLALYRKILFGQRMDLMVGASSLEIDNEFLFYKHLKDFVDNSNVLKLVIKSDHTYRDFDGEGSPITSADDDFANKMEELGYLKNDGSILPNDGFPDWQYIKDLKKFLPENYEELLKSFNQNAQRKIKKANELSINVRAIDLDEMSEFKSVTLETAQRQGFSDKSIEYYTDFYKSFADKCEFLTAEIDFNKSIKRLEDMLNILDKNSKKNKQRINSLNGDLDRLKEFKNKSGKDVLTLANMVLIYQKNEVVYFLGGSLSDYQKLPGAFILQYEAMKRTMMRGIERYNFFGIEGDFDGSDGVLRFKQNFNGHIIKKTGAFLYFPNPKKYKMTENLKSLKNKIISFIK